MRRSLPSASDDSSRLGGEDQPFFSTDDWFIGHTAMSAGIPDAINATLEAVGEALAVYRRALDGGIDGHLRGRTVRPVFRPYA
jgi:hypothetical protein